MKQICEDPQSGSVTFGWSEVECKEMNGVLLGYEVKLYYDEEETHTERLIDSVTTYTIARHSKPQRPLPKAISVAAINQLGVGDHSPPVRINPSGKTGSE